MYTLNPKGINLEFYVQMFTGMQNMCVRCCIVTRSLHIKHAVIYGHSAYYMHTMLLWVHHFYLDNLLNVENFAIYSLLAITTENVDNVEYEDLGGWRIWVKTKISQVFEMLTCSIFPFHKQISLGLQCSSELARKSDLLKE